jgi:RNA polymerase sigma-70 factor (ECF subfamily)
MSHRLALADLDAVHSIARCQARRLCRTLGRPDHEREDIEQDMLLDLLTRLPSFDPARGTLAAFATVCFQHRASRLATRLRREQRERHAASLDDAVPGQEEALTLADIIPESAGYAAWCGQQTDAVAALERRLDLDRAGAIIDQRDHCICASLTQSTPHELGKQGPLPRSALYRRIGEMRLCLLAAGIVAAA